MVEHCLNEGRDVGSNPAGPILLVVRGVCPVKVNVVTFKESSMVANVTPPSRVSNLGVTFDFLEHIQSSNRRLITDGMSLYAMQYDPMKGTEYRGRVEIGRWDMGGNIPRVIAPPDGVVRGVSRSHRMYEELVCRLFYGLN